jgi:hypothetical protein
VLFPWSMWAMTLKLRMCSANLSIVVWRWVDVKCGPQIEGGIDPQITQIHHAAIPIWV